MAPRAAPKAPPSTTTSSAAEELLATTTVSPPGPVLQYFNRLLHIQPFSFLFFGLYWSIFLTLLSPLSASNHLVMSSRLSECTDLSHAENRRASNGKRVECPSCFRCCFCSILEDREESECALHHYPRPKGSRNKTLFLAYKERQRSNVSISTEDAEARAKFTLVKEALRFGTKYSRTKPYTSAEKDLPTLMKMYRSGCAKLGEVLCPGNGAYLEKKNRAASTPPSDNKFDLSIAKVTSFPNPP